MDCRQVQDLLWERLDDELPGEAAQAFDSHARRCKECARELKAAEEIRFSLRNPAGAEVGEIAAKAISDVYERMDAEKKNVRKNVSLFHGFLSFKPVLGSLAAAAVLVLAIIGLWPQKISAVGLDEIMTQHIICIKEGHFANYKCDTSVEFAQTMLSELGFAPTPFRKKSGSFMKGDVCMINKVSAAHALFKVDGGVVSNFYVKKGYVNLFKNKSVKKIRDGAWRYSSNGYEMVILKEKGGLYAIYTGKLPFEELKRFALIDHLASS